MDFRNQFNGIGGFVLVQNSDSGILNFRTQGKTEEQNLHNRHSEKNKQSPSVTQHMIKFFPYKGDELFQF